jgi:hypothetical protein
VAEDFTIEELRLIRSALKAYAMRKKHQVDKPGVSKVARKATLAAMQRASSLEARVWAMVKDAP